MELTRVVPRDGGVGSKESLSRRSGVGAEPQSYPGPVNCDRVRDGRTTMSLCFISALCYLKIGLFRTLVGGRE